MISRSSDMHLPIVRVRDFVLEGVLLPTLLRRAPRCKWIYGASRKFLNRQPGGRALLHFVEPGRPSAYLAGAVSFCLAWHCGGNRVFPQPIDRIDRFQTRNSGEMKADTGRKLSSYPVRGKQKRNKATKRSGLALRFCFPQVATLPSPMNMRFGQPRSGRAGGSLGFTTRVRTSLRYLKSQHTKAV